MSALPSSPMVSENNVGITVEKLFDENHSNGNSPVLTFDRDVEYAPMSTARCYFGITSVNDMIYVTGTFQ